MEISFYFQVYWLFPPTPRNLSVYENWVLSGNEGDVLADCLEDCQKITLLPDNTFIIPSGKSDQRGILVEWLDVLCYGAESHQGPVVQSIVSLTSSLRGQLVKCFTTL